MNRAEQQELYLRSTEKLPFKDIDRKSVVKNAIRAIDDGLSTGRGHAEVFYPQMLTDRDQERVRRSLDGSLKGRVIFIAGIMTEDGNRGTVIEISKKRR